MIRTKKEKGDEGERRVEEAERRRGAIYAECIKKNNNNTWRLDLTDNWSHLLPDTIALSIKVIIGVVLF